MEIYKKSKPTEKLPAGRPNKFTNEYMMMVARKVVDEGMTYREASKTFDCSQGAIADWIKRYRKGGLNKKAPVKTKEYRICMLEDSIKDLKQEIGELYLENLMLKKALSHSRYVKKQHSSVITSENLEQFQEGVE